MQLMQGIPINIVPFNSINQYYPVNYSNIITIYRRKKYLKQNVLNKSTRNSCLIQRIFTHYVNIEHYVIFML
jgi:hypothetical protein